MSNLYFALGFEVVLIAIAVALNFRNVQHRENDR